MEHIIGLSRYLPIISTFISFGFAWIILTRYRQKPEAFHLLWWGIGVVAYGLGTLVESLYTLFGWSELLFKSWYVTGALLGGAPLSIGTLYLLFGRKAGHVGVFLLCLITGITSIFVFLSPIRSELIDQQLLSSNVLQWQKIRLISPFINGAAFLILVGGAIYSAIRFFSQPATRYISTGNILIAIGAVLPGIGGLGSRLGHTELLYFGEFLGIILIWCGYRLCQTPWQSRNTTLLGKTPLITTT